MECSLVSLMRSHIVLCKCLTARPGQTAIITGSAQGIGAATAKILAREGCKVVIADLDKGTHFQKV